jgi:NADP-dependent aldehyde dehydrogenase
MTDSYQPSGKHLIAGEWVAGDATFSSQPATGAPHRFAAGTAAHVDRAAKAAEEAFWSYGYASRAERAAFLNAIADAIEARGPQITEIGSAETGLPAARLEGERGRTAGQLRLFASHIEKGDFLDRRHDAAQPDRKPAARPDIRLVQRALGPVGVFGASNFPLAFSTAGGDTASALAAGCPVVVKGHPGHPGTAEIIAEAILEAIEKCGVHPGVFSLVQSNTREAGEALVQHPLIKAIGFTGSLKGGRALFDLASARPEPIPFFGELGSVNPMFLMPHAAGSLTMGVGQFCTNPGLGVVVDGPEADAFEAVAADAMAKIGAQTMLSDGIASAFQAGQCRIRDTDGVRELVATGVEGRNVGPWLYAVSGETFLANPALAEEVFGPLGVLVKVRDEDEMMAVARGLEGQLTCSLHLDQADTPLAAKLVPVLERKAGRLLANGFPTGVEVVDSMMHGGPYPASTNVSTTSVGTLAIRRFLRPVAYQNMPAELLPEDIRSI